MNPVILQMRCNRGPDRGWDLPKSRCVQVTSRTQISQLPEKSLSPSSQSRPGGLSDMVGVSKAPFSRSGIGPGPRASAGGGESALQSHLGQFLYVLSKRVRPFKQGSDLPAGPHWAADGAFLSVHILPGFSWCEQLASRVGCQSRKPCIFPATQKPASSAAGQPPVSTPEGQIVWPRLPKTVWTVGICTSRVTLES